MLVNLNGKKYEGTPFYSRYRATALEESQSEGYRSVFMNELADLKNRSR